MQRTCLAAKFAQTYTKYKLVDKSTNRLKKKIQIRDFKLKSLLEITRAINSNTSTDELLKLYENTLTSELQVAKLLLFTEENAWTCILKYGIEEDVEDITNESYFNQNDNISINLQSDSDSQLESFDIIIPVYHDDKPLAYLLLGDQEDLLGISPAIKHMNFIQTITNIIIVAIKNKKLVEDNLRQEVMKRELKLAAEMQAMLVPNKLPKNESHEVSAVYLPHQQVGGDYYDFMNLTEDEVMFCMADVSGKGLAAAFLMSNFQATLRAIFNYTYGEKSLVEIVTELNARVMDSAMGEKYITFFIATYNTKTRELNYINAGHNPPILVNFNDKSSELLKLGGVGLGMFDELPSLSQGKLTLQPNSMIVCFTDGLIELENEELEELGNEKLIEMIFDHEKLSIEDFNRMIMSEAVLHKGNMPYIDDIALLSCKFF